MRFWLAIRVALMVLACVLWSAAARAEGACLSGQVGEALSAKLAAHAFDGALPAGWTLREVGVASDHIDVGTVDDQGRPRNIALWPAAHEAARVDGRGRSFTFILDAGSPPLDDTARHGLLELASRVDAAVPESEALRVCDPPRLDQGSSQPQAHRGELPRWIPLTVGGLELTVIVAWCVGRRSKRPEKLAEIADAQRLRPLHVAVVTGGLALFALSAVPAIPYDMCDLCYLFSLEDGTWTPQEWMHPLWVPLLDGYRAVLGAFGFHGHMLVPVELLNLGTALAALGLLFLITRRVTRDSLLAAAAMLTMAGCDAFWHASVRSTPYALALLCLTGSLALLVSDDAVPPRRYAAAGALAGLTMALHASAMALGPVALVCALREPDPDKTYTRTMARTAAFGVAMTGVAATCWALFMAQNHITPEYFRSTPLATAFAGVEQVPNSSIYTSHDPLRQISDFARTLLGRNLVLCCVGGPLVLLAVWQRRRGARPTAATPIEQRLTTAALANLVILGAFFLINNTHNGFIFASLALVPTWLAVLATRLQRGRTVFRALATLPAALLVGMAVVGLRAGVDYAADPLEGEIQYLDKQLGAKDVVLTPGCPFPELDYLVPMNLLAVHPAGVEAPSCQVPRACIDQTLVDRVDSWTTGGTRVLYALGDDVADFSGGETGSDNPNGAEKRRQIFWDPRLAAPERARYLASVRTALEGAGLLLGAVITSPGGQRYAEVRPRAGGGSGGRPSAAPFTATELGATFGDRDPVLSMRARVLADMGAALPTDPWHACDVMQLACEVGAVRQGAPLCASIDGCTRCEPLLGARPEAQGSSVSSAP